MAQLEVANTILQQLGGRKFIVMTGARNFVGSDEGLSFRLPGSGGFCKAGINCVQVTLMPSDTYNVTFSRLRGDKLTVVSEFTDIYCDGLRELFTRETGLETSLGTMAS